MNAPAAASLEARLLERSRESGVTLPRLRAVFLRAGSPEQAWRRVDEFIVYSTLRDPRYSRDRDLT